MEELLMVVSVKCLISSWLLGCSVANVTAAELLLLTNEASPTSFVCGESLCGFAVELVEALIQRTGQPAHIELQPWTRIYQLAQRTPDTAVFTIVRTPAREALFQWVGPIFRGTTSLYSLKSSHLQVTDITSAMGTGTVAAPKLWYSYDTLKTLGFTELYATRGPEQMVKMLKAGRVKLIPTEDLTLAQVLASGGLTPAEVEAQVPLLHSDYYIAFSPQTDPAVVAQWQQQLDGMTEDGSLTAVLQRWLQPVRPTQLSGANGSAALLR
jgi:polar amino acid transport system substrate-binding protein